MKAAAEKRLARLRALVVQLRRLERRLYRVSVPLAGIRAALERPQALPPRPSRPSAAILLAVAQ
jgi:hypothetical protein